MKRVAILVGDPALTSILTGLIDELPEVQVYQFQSVSALTTFMRISVVDLLMGDEDFAGLPPEELVRGLRDNTALINRDFKFIVLKRGNVLRGPHETALPGSDEVLSKPMSPRYLQARIQHHLKLGGSERSAHRYVGPERRRSMRGQRSAPLKSQRRQDGNVIHLFG